MPAPITAMRMGASLAIRQCHCHVAPTHYADDVAHFMVAASGPDQPGIVAEFTRVFVDRGCNLEDTSMTVLRGHFAMMLVVDAPDGISPPELESDLSFATTALGLIVNVWEISGLVQPTVGGERWTVSLRGADQRGIVHGIADVLSGCDANIVDVSTRLEDSGDYSMLLDVIVPPGTDRAVRGALADAAQRLSVELSLERADRTGS
jgi:glycine cleavage system transcriptional repressor